MHVGAIAGLIDTAGVAVIWSDDTIPDTFAGSTATMTIEHLTAARGKDLHTTATTRQRRELADTRGC